MNKNLIKNLKQLASYFRTLGFFPHIQNSKSIVVHYHYMNLLDEEIDSDCIEFSGSSIDSIIAKFEDWYADKSIWLDADRVLCVEHWRSPYDFDLAMELLDLGFKYIEVSHEDSNFVSVEAKYCYQEEGAEFRFDGSVDFTGYGDKFAALNQIKLWVNSHSEFVPTKNRY